MIKGIEKRTRLVIGISVLTIIIVAFEWSIIDLITPFLMMPLLAVTFLVFFVGLAFSLSCLFKFKEIKWLALVPLLVQLAAIFILVFVPFTKIWVNADFHFYKSQRQDVVERVVSGDLVANVSYNSSLIALGYEYSKISMGGNEIIVQERDNMTYILFFTFRGILDNYSGFLYVPDGGDPRNFRDLHEDDVTQIIKYGENWYYISHH